MTITITAETVAWYGAIVASLAFIISVASVILKYISYRKNDLPRLKIECLKNRKVFGDTIYDTEKTYLSITTTNVGKRPITVTNVGYVTKDKNQSNYLFSDSLLKGAQKLNDGEFASYMIEQDSIDFKTIKHLEVHTSMGKVYKTNKIKD